MLRCDTERSLTMARATAMVRSVSSVSAMRHSCFGLPTYLGMIAPGVPSNPWTPSGYHLKEEMA